MKAVAITGDTATGRPSGAASVAALAGALAGVWVAGASAQVAGVGGAFGRPLVTPGVHASATYTDNSFLAPDGQEDNDVVVEVSPYVRIEGASRRAQYQLFYQLRNFWRADGGESTLYRHSLNAKGAYTLVEERLGIDASGFMGTLNDPTAGPIAFDPAASDVNTSNVRHFSISPWLRGRFADSANYEMRYTLGHTGGNTGFAVADIDQHVSASLAGLADQSATWHWRWYGDVQRRDYDEVNVSLDRQSTGVALYYRLTQALRVFGTVDYEQIDEVRNSDGDDSGIGPGLGFEWVPNPRTSVSAAVSRRYYGTVSQARAAYTMPRATIGVAYSRAVQTAADTALLFFDPQALTTAVPGVANPVLGDPGSSTMPPANGALSQSLVTDVGLLESRVVAYYAIYNPRNSFTLSAFASKRAPPSGTTLAPGIVNAFVGELRERGAAAVLRHRLNPRSAVEVGADYRRNESSSNGFDTHAAMLGVRYVAQLTTSTSFFTGVRHTRQRSSGNGAEYDENAVYGGIDMSFR